MRHIIKTSFILATIVLGAVFCQAPSNTTANGSALPQNGTNIPPQGSTQRPKGSGVMRSGNAPQGPSNLPPQEPGITDKLAAITDNTLVSLKNILQYLPPVEQDLIADCFNSNTDLTRLVSPDCYKSNFTNTVRLPLSKGISGVLTNNSQTNRQGLGCLKKVADSYGTANDTTTATISSDVDSAATDQIPFNQATSAFVTTVLNILNARRKFLLTTTSLLNESISGYDAQGYATGFVYNTEDQKTVVSAFKVYANYIYNFFSNLNTKVSSIQGLIGKLDACKPPETNTTTTAKRLLQAPAQGSQQAPTSGSQQAPTSGSQQGPTSGTQQGPTSGTQQGPTSGTQQGPTSGTQQGPTSGTQQGPMTQGAPSGSLMAPQAQNGTSSQMGPQPSGKKPEGGKQTGKDGRPQANIPIEIAYLQGNITSALASKTGAWNTLKTEIINNLNPTSGYKPNGGLIRSVLQRVNGAANQVLLKEFTKFQRKNETACTNDYLYYCKDGLCACADNNCPAEVAVITSVSLATSVSQTFSNRALRYLQDATTTPPTNGITTSGQPPQQAPTDLPTKYLICSVCLSGKRYSYAQASFQNGNYIDFSDGSVNFGKEGAKEKNNCANALASGTAEQKADCRGNMSDDCAKKMDNTCGATGLYLMLVNNPLPQSALPAVCDDTATGYSESSCFQWLMPKITKATIVFDYRRFGDLPREIANSFATAARLLQTDAAVKVVAQDPVQLKDPTAVLPSSVSQITSSEVAVDGATSVAAPTASQYITDLAQTSANVTLAQSFLSASINLLVIALFALLF